MEKQDLPGIPEDDVIVRLFINGTYISSTTNIRAHRSISDKAIVIDVEYEVFPAEDK